MIKRTVHFANVSLLWPFLPYHWGLLRAFAEADARIADAYEFAEPIYLPRHRAELSLPDAPFLFAASCYVWNFRVHMKLLREIKELHPSCVTVAGGPHIPGDATQFLAEHPYVDIAVHGEGELPFQRLLLELLEDVPDLRRVPRISFRESDRIARGGADSAVVRLGPASPPADSLPQDLSHVPSPYLLGFFDGMVKDLRAREGKVWMLWESNRGCPYGCSFCEWGAAALAKLKRFDNARLMAELAWAADFDIEVIYCADANFGILERDKELAEQLSRLKRERGAPRYFSANFAKNSNDRVFEISKLLIAAQMYRGTTLAMQSVQGAVLDAVNRKTIGIERYRELKQRYDAVGIPTYVDLIFPLPKETLGSWLQGLCDLIATGHHENIRCFELYLLPNTEMNTSAQRETYAFQTTWKKITDQLPPDEAGEGEFVFGTSTVSFDDWVDGRVFFDVLVAAMHNGAYTRFLSRYLNDTGVLSYHDFYVGLFEDEEHPSGGCLRFVLDTMSDAIRSYATDPDQAENCQVKTQPRLRSEVERFIDAKKKHRWWTRDWAWFAITQRLDAFYEEIAGFLRRRGAFDDDRLEDILAFQKDLMLTEGYSPEHGKTRTYRLDWPRYFFGDGTLAPGAVTVSFTDVAMGVDHQHRLVPDSPADFALAACGMYFPDGTHRRFFHQPDRMMTVGDAQALRRG